MAIEDLNGLPPNARPDIIFKEMIPAEVQLILRAGMDAVQHNPSLANRDLSIYAQAETADNYIMHSIPEATVEHKARRFRPFRRLIHRATDSHAA